MNRDDFFLNGVEYPTLFGPPEITLDDTHWLDVPVRGTGSAPSANWYITGTGIADVSTDPGWLADTVNRGYFLLEFPDDPPLQSGDQVLDASATVGFGHVERDTVGGDWAWALALDGVKVIPPAPGANPLQLIIYATYKTDIWVDCIAYQVDLLVHRPFYFHPVGKRVKGLKVTHNPMPTNGP